MKIRTQSFILVAGIVAMPLIVFSLFIVVERLSFEAREASRFEERRPLGSSLRYRALGALPSEPREAKPALPFDGNPRELRAPPTAFPRGAAPMAPPSGPSGDLGRPPMSGPMRTEDMIRRFFIGKPESIRMAIVGPDGLVAFSDIEALPTGTDFARGIIEASKSVERDRILAFGVAPQMPRGYTAIVSLPHSEFIPLWLRQDLIKAGILIIAAILAFAAAMCVVIVRSITRSVLSLEAATKRVAAGELDIPVALEGNNEIASLSRSLDRLRIEIKEDQVKRARFIMGISHDLKTPLALVKGYAEALEEELGGSGPVAASHLGIIQSKADQLEGMIDDLLDFERVDAGEWSRGLADVDLGAFLHSFARRVEADATLLGRELRSAVDLPPSAIVRMDERLATRALENLVNNSLRYTAPGERIVLEARAEAEAFVIVVSDEGPGISAEDLPHIFEPFFRGSSSRREQGMGLGLSIVKTIVESHGWTIEAGPGSEASGAPKGAAFVLSIPRRSSAHA